MKTTVAFALVASTFAFGCDDDNNLNDVTVVGNPDAAVADAAVQTAAITWVWTAAVTSTDSASTIAGDARVQWTVDQQQFTAALATRNDNISCDHPWQVDSGTCATGGSIVGSASDYPLIVSAPDGTATVTATVPVALSTALAYHVTIHYSSTQADRVIACGDLVLGEPQ